MLPPGRKSPVKNVAAMSNAPSTSGMGDAAFPFDGVATTTTATITNSTCNMMMDYGASGDCFAVQNSLMPSVSGGDLRSLLSNNVNGVKQLKKKANAAGDAVHSPDVAAANKKKKRYSGQQLAQRLSDEFDFGDTTTSAGRKFRREIKVTDLPYLPLSYVCSKLSLVEREAVSQVSHKFALANRMAWFRRTCFNVKSDVASYINLDENGDQYDNSFDFVALFLLKDKFRRLLQYFEQSANLRSIDFSAPPDEDLRINRWCVTTVINTDLLSKSFSSIVKHKISEINLKNTIATDDVLKICSTSFGPTLKRLTLSIDTLVWQAPLFDQVHGLPPSLKEDLYRKQQKTSAFSRQYFSDICDRVIDYRRMQNQDDTIDAKDRNNDNRSARCIKNENGLSAVENNRASFTAELTRKDGASLGFNIDGGVDKNAPPIISKLRPGSIAYRCDELQVGDFLIAVNGIKVLTLKYEEILILLRNATDTIILTIEYDLNTLCFDEQNHKSVKSTDVYLSKESGSFGFTIRGGSYGPYSEKSRPLTVTHVRPGGPADREGKIRVGDRLIGIDGIDISTCTLNAALTLLRKCKERNVCLTLEYDVAILESAKNANGQFLLEINKATGLDFGLNLKFRHSTQGKIVVVDSVAEASLADRCGAIKIGDEIISVDQMTLEYSTLPEVHQLLKNNDQDRIKLEIRRYGDHLSLLKNRRESSSDAEPNSEDKNEEKINVSTNDSRYAKINVADVTKNKESTKVSLDEYAKIIKDNKMIRKQSGGHHHKRARSSGPRSVRCNSNTGRSCFETGCSLTATVSSLPCGQVCRGETMELTLNCWARGGYGFIVHRSHSPDLGHQTTIISYIERGSPADKCGVLQIGDRILAINDWCTASGTAEEANYIIRHASGPLNLTVEFDVMETVLPSSGIFTVKLAKRGQNLGITLNNSATGHKGESVTVKDIRLGSVSHRCGSIQPDDQILSIDNIPLDTCTVDEAIRLLQKSSDIIKLRVKKNYTPFDDMEPATNTVVYTVELSRKGGPLGVTVASTDDNVDPIVISHLAPGGIAEKTGALHVGDRILAINGHSLNGKRVSEAVQLMKQNKDTVSFKIARFVLDHSRYGHHGHILTRGLLMDRPVMVDHYLDMDADGKLGTPVQSIDSAVESLEDSPLAECQQPCTSSSNRNSQNSNSKASSVSGGGGGTMDAAPFAEDLHIQLHKTLSTLKSAGSSSTGSSGQTSHGCRSEVSSSVSMAPTEDEQHYVQLGGESCPCKTHSNCDQQSHQDWMHFIDALENVSEAEMLKKLEETILSGSLPVTSSSTAARPTTPRPPPKPLNPPFPLTNTILKHPYSNKTVGGADGSSPVVGAVRSRDILGGAGSILLTGHFSSSSPGPVGSRQSILSGYENIPLITSPINADLRTPNDPGESHSHDDSNDTSPGDEDECLREMPPLETSSLASRLAAGFRDNTDLSTGILRNRTLPSAAPSSSLYSKNSSPIGQGHGAGPGLPLEFYRVTLLKDTTYNDFGFSVSDGVAEKGIFINKVRPKGPADFSGNIRPYDKLLQVNDTSLKDLDCLLAVPILAAAGDKIDLFICRDPNLILNRRPESIEEEDEEDDQQQQQQKIMQRLTPEQTQV